MLPAAEEEGWKEGLPGPICTRRAGRFGEERGRRGPVRGVHSSAIRFTEPF